MQPEACTTATEALRIEAVSPTPDSTAREGEMEGVLHVVGELGYRGASVRAVLEYSGSHRKQFYEHFTNLEDCFEQAYAARVERLGVSLLEAAAAASSWRESVRSGLVRLFRFVAEQPAVARSLFVEVQVAGGAALAEHDEAAERLAAALDSVRGEIPAGEEPPQSAGIFVVGGVEACICDVLATGKPERIWDTLPELMHLAVGSYLGNEAAEREFEAVRELLEHDRGALVGEGR
jgi:AcrR family transcriptional regulator